MLATFSQTGGLTGAEVGIAAATGFLNQKLLGALFGEAALVEMISRARTRLVAALGETFREELARFEGLVPAPGRIRTLAGDLRSLADELRALPPSVSVSARPVMLPDLPRLADGAGGTAAGGTAAGGTAAQTATPAQGGAAAQGQTAGRTEAEAW
jgi:hypothetical protein